MLDRFDERGYNPETHSTVDEMIYLREAFLGSFEGVQTFKWLMRNLGLFKPVMNEQDAGLQTFALKLLGVMQLSSIDKLDHVIESFKEAASLDGLTKNKLDTIRRSYVGTDES